MIHFVFFLIKLTKPFILKADKIKKLNKMNPFVPHLYSEKKTK